MISNHFIYHVSPIPATCTNMGSIEFISIKLTWEAPDEPNGAIIWYGVYRDNLLIYQGIPSGNPLGKMMA